MSYEFKQNPTTDYDEGFVVKDGLTGQPIKDFAYRIKTAGGQTVNGATAANGATSIVNASAVEAMHLEPEITPIKRLLTPKA